MRKLTRAKLLMLSLPRPANKQCRTRYNELNTIKIHLELTKAKAVVSNLEEVETDQLQRLLVKVWILLFFHLCQVNVEEISWVVWVSAHFVLRNTFPVVKG